MANKNGESGGSNGNDSDYGRGIANHNRSAVGRPARPIRAYRSDRNASMAGLMREISGPGDWWPLSSGSSMILA